MLQCTGRSAKHSIAAYLALFRRNSWHWKVTLNACDRSEKGVAHSFGRDSSCFEDTFDTANDRAARLSEVTLLSWLASIEQAGIAIDEHLLHNHLGEFEIVRHFHRWRMLPRSEKEPKYSEPAAFSRFLNLTIGSTPVRDHCRQLERYYDQL